MWFFNKSKQPKSSAPAEALDGLFKPESVAIIGASREAGSVGNDIVKNLQTSFRGGIFPVNPKAEEINGLRCYPNLKAIKDKIDLAVIAVPAAIVPAILNEAGQKGVKAAVVISAGFKESGHGDLEEEIKRIASKYGLIMIGPNCLGILNPARGLNASFAPVMPPRGPVAFLSQSGALATAIIDAAKEMGIGFSKFVSLGNKAVIDEAVLLEYLARDRETKVIVMYAEQLSDPDTLLPIMKKLSRGAQAKPLVILKSGKTSAGQQASASHTGALAGNDAAYSALFRQGGALRANNVEELFSFIKIFQHNKLAPAKRLAVLTNAGGPGVLAIDAAVEKKLLPAAMTARTKKALAVLLPPAANTNNPIDILGDAKADRYRLALDKIMADPAVDSVLAIMTPQAGTEIEATAQVLAEAQRRSAKPLAAAFMGGELAGAGLEILQRSGVAAFRYPEEAVRALAAFDKYFQATSRKEAPAPELENIDQARASQLIKEARQKGLKNLTEAAARPILAAYGLPMSCARVAHSPAEAAAIAREAGRPLALKIISPDILHKSDAGGIMLGVAPAEAEQKFSEMMARVAKKQPSAKIEGVLMTEMIKDSGVEMILGSVRDQSMGPVIMLGLGGIYVEILQDVAFGINNLTPGDIERMISGLRANRILEGARGGKAGDKEALIDCVRRVARLVRDFPEIKELDINPLLVKPRGRGAIVMDARIVLEY